MIRNFLKDAREILFNKRISNMNSSSVQGAIDELKGTIGYTKKNHFKSITSGFTYNGITAQENEDGSFTVTGTATDTVDYQLGVTIEPENEQYILSGYTEGADENCNIYAAFWEDTSTWLSAEGVLDDKGVLITKEKGNLCNVCLHVASGTTVNMTFYPMVRYASITDDTYEPYDGVGSVDSRLNSLESGDWKRYTRVSGTNSVSLWDLDFKELRIDLIVNNSGSTYMAKFLDIIRIKKEDLPADSSTSNKSIPYTSSTSVYPTVKGEILLIPQGYGYTIMRINTCSLRTSSSSSYSDYKTYTHMIVYYR